MRVLITGADGFVARNLIVHLSEMANIQVQRFTRKDSIETLDEKISNSDFVFHLAGVNRPDDEKDFFKGNAELTNSLCDAVRKEKRNIPIIYSSSVQAEHDNAYGKSKWRAETELKKLAEQTKNTVYIYRLPNVFGKWSRPNYNSVVATFCHNIAHDLPISINDETALIKLVYIDDVIESFLDSMSNIKNTFIFIEIKTIYNLTVGDLAKKIQSFKSGRKTLITEEVGSGLLRALYSTYLSYFKPKKFNYEVPIYSDSRGEFVEMLKTPETGQFSYFTAFPGVTRGGHYHHTKTEKFLVIRGHALFKFRHIITDEYYEFTIKGGNPQIIETVPGWSHDVTNIGENEMIVMLWANEVFDRIKPDTYPKIVKKI